MRGTNKITLILKKKKKAQLHLSPLQHALGGCQDVTFCWSGKGWLEGPEENCRCLKN